MTTEEETADETSAAT